MEEKEEWRPIEGFEGYEVSNLGYIRSYRRGKKGTKLKIIKEVKGSYCVVNIFQYNKQCTKKVHRLVAQAFIPNPENKPQVNHIDGDKTNNKVSNLEWCTSKENIKHAFKIGLSSNRGEGNPQSKLTDINVKYIRNTKKSIKELSSELGISKVSIWEARNYKTWKHI